MVMEFPDNVLNLDGHQSNSAQLKQFIQVNTSVGFQGSHTSDLAFLRLVLLLLREILTPGMTSDTSACICDYVLVPK